MLNTRPTETPMPQNAILQGTDETPATKEEIKLYQQIIGSVMYAMVVSRPDIAYTVGALARHVQNPQKEYWNAVWHLLRYLNTMKVLGITYQGTPTPISAPSPTNIEFISMSDSDWVGD